MVRRYIWGPELNLAELEDDEWAQADPPRGWEVHTGPRPNPDDGREADGYLAPDDHES